MYILFQGHQSKVKVRLFCPMLMFSLQVHHGRLCQGFGDPVERPVRGLGDE